MRILVIDDEESTRKGIELFLRSEGHEVCGSSNGVDAFKQLENAGFDLCISDVRMPEMDGLALLDKMQESRMDVPVLMMTAYATVEEAVKALQKGASDYLTKPLNLDELAFKIRKMTEHSRLVRENLDLKKELDAFKYPKIIGASPAILKVKQAIARLAHDSDVPVIIVGESGTGKELVAKTIHEESARSGRPFVAINCAAFQDALLESELFGHKKGAFTGAFQDKAGFFLAANKGTLFLDEVGEMSAQMQSKLLRALQEQTIQPVGSVQSIKVDVRVIGASNRDLKLLVAEGQFREDLFYRLNVIEIDVPPLRERPEDIPLLLEHFQKKYRSDKKRLQLSASVLSRLEKYAWPGNIRELENLVRRLLTIRPDGIVEITDLPEQMIVSQSDSSGHDWSGSNYKEGFDSAVRNFEKEFFAHHLRLNAGNISKTAEATGISRVALHQKIKKYGLNE